MFARLSSLYFLILALLVLTGPSLTAEEANQHLLTALSTTTISGFVDTSAQWNMGAVNPPDQVPEPSAAVLAGIMGVWIYRGLRRSR